MSFELTSSQESLPLSQETFAYSYNGIPSPLRAFLFSDNFQNSMKENNSFQVGNMESFPVAPLNLLPAQQSSLPSVEDFPGFFNFTVTVPTNEVASKSSSYICSSMLKRVYVNKDTPCPFNFSATEGIRELVEPSYVRATIYFSSPENINDVVVRCVNHKYPDAEKGDQLCEHILKSESRNAEYFKDTISNRCSVVVPFENPPMGQDFSTYVYKFSCYTSCSGGPNRRPICVVFTLENQTRIMGRRKIDVRVCSCPYRDKTTEENKFMQANNLSDMPSTSESSLLDITNDYRPVARSSAKRKRDESSEQEKEYIIRVRNRECYTLLRGVKAWFEIVKLTQARNNWVPSSNDIANLLSMLTGSESEKSEKEEK